MARPCAIGVDIGGTKCAAGLVLTADGSILARRQVPTNAARGGAAVLADIVELTAEIIDEGAGRGAIPTGIGVGVAELVDPAGRVLSDATIAWRGVDVARELGEMMGLPVELEADVRAAARA